MRTFLLSVLAMTLVLSAPGRCQGTCDPASDAFFRRLLALNGRVLKGATVHPTDPQHEMVGKPLVLRVQVVSADEVRVPFAVGEDASRTWVLKRTPEDLLFKHDHRLPDGSPDPVTNYGGLAVPGLMSGVQLFPADGQTVQMLPEASSNVWCLQLSPDGRTLVYSLERHQQPRYEARFQLGE